MGVAQAESISDKTNTDRDELIALAVDGMNYRLLKECALRVLLHSDGSGYKYWTQEEGGDELDCLLACYFAPTSDESPATPADNPPK